MTLTEYQEVTAADTITPRQKVLHLRLITTSQHPPPVQPGTVLVQHSPQCRVLPKQFLLSVVPRPLLLEPERHRQSPGTHCSG